MAQDSSSSAAKRSTTTHKRNVRWSGASGLKGQRKEVILRSAASVLRNSRLSSLTIQDVADELGMTKGNLYYYFKDKNDILYQCHMRSMEISLRALKEARTKGKTPADKLRILLAGHIRGILDDNFGGVLQADLEDFRPEQRKPYIKKRDELEHGVRRMIEDGIRQGEFEPVNVKLAGFAILGAINWIPKWYRSTGALSSDAIVEGMVNYFLRGLQRQSAVPQKRSARINGTKTKTPKAKAATSMED